MIPGGCLLEGYNKRDEILSLVSIWTFLPFVACFGFSYQRKATTSNVMLKWKRSQKTKRATKSHNEHQKAFARVGF